MVRDAVTYCEHAKRKTVTAMDVVYALKSGKDFAWLWRIKLLHRIRFVFVRNHNRIPFLRIDDRNSVPG